MDQAPNLEHKFEQISNNANNPCNTLSHKPYAKQNSSKNQLRLIIIIILNNNNSNNNHLTIYIVIHYNNNNNTFVLP